MTAAILASLVLNYDNLSDANYLLKLGVIISATKDSDLFRPYPPDGSPERLEEMRTRLQEAYDGALDRSHKMIELRNATRKETDVVLYTMGHHIQSQCQGDVNRLGKSGYDIRQPRNFNSRTTSPPSAPTTFVVEPAQLGHLKFKVVPTRGSSFCEIWYTDDEPTVEANWKYKSGFAEFEGVVGGFEPGTKFIKVRLVGKGGPSGWSNTITIIVE